MCARAEAGLWGRGRAWPSFKKTHRTTHQRPSPTGVEAPEGPQGLAAAAVGGGGAWPGFKKTHRTTRQRPGATGVEGAGGTGGHGRASRRGAERSEDA